ncbi:pyrroline-5-carboxylate reductase [Candidatus Regiella insecticola 5.15]|uniref:Pyrroline-5-carboxylate reductase n=1 Tax=Candidatus Regiella insecticola 5.15 TaxID=1005043 RepID=G2H2G6_9ENTR|nr:pyrroline-5-carboxylate reductase [Candidatus Regiella insecticola]EGY27805.1 pyrroline-5-carboxylate reductase [Candidatus Regiella insecticola 5.15]
MEHRSIAFIGAGNMARAIIAGLCHQGYPSEKISVCAPSGQNRDALANEFGVIGSADNIVSAQQAEVIVLAVKPQIMATVCESLKKKIDFSKKLVLSIAAGMSIARFYALLGDKLNIIRIMPNLPVSVGKGMSGLFAPENTVQSDRDFTQNFMRSVGEVCWLNAESDINTVIAAAGSAPAYFFLLMDAMQQEAIKQGFDAEKARLLIQQAASGAAALVEAKPQCSLSELCNQVTSKGGTTEAALKIFEENNMANIVSQAMQAAITRAEEMEKSL